MTNAPEKIPQALRSQSNRSLQTIQSLAFSSIFLSFSMQYITSVLFIYSTTCMDFCSHPFPFSFHVQKCAEPRNTVRMFVHCTCRRRHTARETQHMTAVHCNVAVRASLGVFVLYSVEALGFAISTRENVLWDVVRGDTVRVKLCRLGSEIRWLTIQVFIISFHTITFGHLGVSQTQALLQSVRSMHTTRLRKGPI